MHMLFLLITLALITGCMAGLFLRLNFRKRKKRKQEIDMLRKRLKHVMEIEKNMQQP